MTLIGSATVTVNAAFLREIKEVHEELWQSLDDVRKMSRRNSLTPGDWQRFVENLDLLHDQITLHFALEEAYGYFEDPAYAAPHLCERAESLRGEHRSLYLEIAQLAEDAETTRLTEARYRALISRFRQFDARFRRHEEAEEGLILAFYDEDLGVGD